MTNEQMEAMVESMCLTWRHDFGIEKPAPAGNWFDSIVSGTTLEERHTLRERMRQLVERHFKPALVALRAPVERQALQAEGKHPAPCARFCEATAFEVEIRSLKAQLAQAVERQTPEWQPIDTAPKDRRILVWTGQERYAAHWAQNPSTGDEAWIVAEWGDERDQALVRPTHWAELPAAPSAPGREET